MISAVILVRLKPGMEKNIVERVKELDQVKFATMIYSDYDLLAEVKVESLSELDKFVFEQFRQIPGVESTKTLISTRIVKE